MKQDIIISIKGTQTTPNEEPEVVELTTSGILEQTKEGFSLCYQESPLTGLEGTTTVFRVEGNRVSLERTGNVESKMEFEEGRTHESLYQIEGGALLLRVYTKTLHTEQLSHSGRILLSYLIEIENEPSGMIDYAITYQIK